MAIDFEMKYKNSKEAMAWKWKKLTQRQGANCLHNAVFVALFVLAQTT